MPPTVNSRKYLKNGMCEVSQNLYIGTKKHKVVKYTVSKKSDFDQSHQHLQNKKASIIFLKFYCSSIVPKTMPIILTYNIFLIYIFTFFVGTHNYYNLFAFYGNCFTLKVFKTF